MESPLIIALSRQLAIKREVELLANNLANSTTPGFKGEAMVFSEYVKQSPGGEPLSFVQDMGLARNMAQGQLKNSGNPLDLALDGDGWFVIRADSEDRYTRNGHFRLSQDGAMITSAGNPVLGVDGGPIVFTPDDTEIVFSSNGTVSANGESRGQLQIVAFEDLGTLSKASGSLFRSTAESIWSDASLAQGVIEESNVRPVVELTQLVKAMRSYQSAQKMVDAEHRRQRTAIDRLTREN